MVKVHTRSEEQVMTKRALMLVWIASVLPWRRWERVNLEVSERVLRRWS